MTTDAELIDRIVRGVLESLQTPAVAVRSSSASVAAVEAKAEPAKVVAPAPIALPINELRLTETVITAEVLEKSWKQQPRIAVVPKAVLTPSARDYLKKRKIEVVRTGAAASKSATPSEVSASAAITTPGTARWRAFVVQTHPQLERILEEAGGKGSSWERMLPTSLPESIAAAVSSVLRAEVSGSVILTHQPLVASCRANRHARIRAAAVGDVAAINAARRQIGPNLYCVDPSGKSYFELRNLIRAIASGGVPAPPEGWME